MQALSRIIATSLLESQKETRQISSRRHHFFIFPARVNAIDSQTRVCDDKILVAAALNKDRVRKSQDWEFFCVSFKSQ